MKKGRDSGNKGENDRDVWVHVTRSVRPYHPSAIPVRQEAAAKGRPAASRAATIRKEKSVLVHPPAVIQRAVALPAPPRGFDRATEMKLRKGRLPLEGILDLHGMTQARAFTALRRFIAAAVEDEKRTLLIITGKGARAEGVLKRLLPLWMEEDAFLSRHLLALTPARPKDGGSGAFYVRLRKPRTS